MKNISKFKKAGFADLITTFIGSWNFIVFQSIVIFLWILTNAFGLITLDPYPFTFLNLALSFQAAFTAPIIMMSQNKQAEIDRKVQHNDFKTDKKAELEVSMILQEIKEIKSCLNIK